MGAHSFAITYNHKAVLRTTSLRSSPSLVDNCKLTTTGGHRGCYSQLGLENSLAGFG